MLQEIGAPGREVPKPTFESTFPAGACLFAAYGDGPVTNSEVESLPSLDDLGFRLAAAFGRHGHICNVLTHISDGNWAKLEQALRTILDPQARSRDLSPLARNIIDLICADRGVTGRIMRPYFRSLLDAILEPKVAARFARQITVLFLEIEKARQPSSNALLPNETPFEREPN
jgi:hypothetical protein